MSAALDLRADDAALAAEVRARGFARLAGQDLAAILGADAAALDAFAASWGRLETDAFMADGGRYRRRRHATFTQARGAGTPARRNPHRPHFQAVVHNRLNGGVERWFAPVEDAVADGAPLRALLTLGRDVADGVSPAGGGNWLVEVHQFRIEAAAGAPGYPTPEGVHHDGVDLVLIAIVARTNLEGGETLVTDRDGRELARFTLEGRLDAVLLDDARVMHGVTPVRAADAARPSCRDVLVATWKRGLPDGRAQGATPPPAAAAL